MRIIWIDDDSVGILSVLANRLSRQGFSVEKFKYYEDAEYFISKQKAKETDRLLIDFILPSKSIKSKAFLGIELAELAVKQGFKNLVFLSVVGENEVIENLSRIKSQQTFEYKYFNKTDIIAKVTWNLLVEFLNNDKEKWEELKNE
jgi:FixJ family two-component response regulator